MVKQIQFSMLYVLQLTGAAVFLVRSAVASSTFNPTCTLPPSTVNFVSSANVRGTLDILWSSLFTLLICTWTVQHLNVPEQTPDCIKWQQKLKETLKRGLTKVKWMLLTLIVPEFLVGRAFQDFIMARESCRQMKEFAETDGIQWTLTHAYYANMGGFVLRVHSFLESKPTDNETTQNPSGEANPFQPLNNQDRDQLNATSEQHAAQDKLGQQLPPSSLEPIDEDKLTQQQSTGPPEPGPQSTVPTPNTGPTIPQPSASNINLETQYAYPNSNQLHALRSRGIIKRLPHVSVKWIEDKSKGDAFIKGTAVLQVLWLVVQVIARGAKRLPISQLEIAVIAFAACTLLTYIFSWAKPQNVAVADLATHEAIARESIQEIENVGGIDYGASWFRILSFRQDVDVFRPIPNDAEFDHLSGTALLTYMDVGMVFAGTIFGAVHLIAWNFHFPTQVESLLWKLAAAYLAAVLPCYYCIAFLFERLGWIESAYQNSNFIAKLIVYLSILSYVLARLCLIVLIFRCLFFLRPETFVTTWASEVPHLQ